MNDPSKRVTHTARPLLTLHPLLTQPFPTQERSEKASKVHRAA
jgi:hypothetical protein